jgi:hypothetical protein
MSFTQILLFYWHIYSLQSHQISQIWHMNQLSWEKEAATLYDEHTHKSMHIIKYSFILFTLICTKSEQMKPML